jgi:hypothetical protein
MNNWFDILKITQMMPDSYTDVNPGFMVKDEIWEEANVINRLASMEEVELGLNRKLTVDDFTDAPINWENDSKKAIYERIGVEGRKKLAEGYLDGEHYPRQHLRYINRAKKITG